MNAQRVSVAMATCEGARFVSDQLESIAAQSLLPDELVVYDDDSEDETPELLQSFAKRAPFRVRVQRNGSRVGVTKNFQRAIAACEGDIVFLADQDDVWLPDKVESVVDVLDQRPEAGAVFSDGEVVSDTLEPLGYSLWESLGFDQRERRRVRAGAACDVFLRHVVAAGTTMAFRARYRDLALPFPDLRSCHDAFTAFVIAAVAEVAIVERRLIRYRLHDANQIGIQKLGLVGQLAKAREQVTSDAFGYADTFFSFARDRLTSQGVDLRPGVSAGIDAKILHARRRAQMSGRGLSRLGDISRETLSRRYWRYSYGWKSVAQDLWLRG